MYSSDFAYYAPTSLGQALMLLDNAKPEVKLLAGGQSLLPLLKLRLSEPATLIDVSSVPELHVIADSGSSITLGAMTTYFQAIDSELVQRRCPLIVQAIRQVGDPQVRARGTIGGSLAHADPAGDLPAAAVALDAEIHTVSSAGERTVMAANFFVDVLTTSLRPNEIVTSVSFAATDRPATGTAYVKHRHPASGYAVVGIAALVTLAPDGTCQEARIGITGAGTHAVRAGSVEQALAGKTLDQATLEAACNSAPDGLDLMSDSYASAEFRAHLTRVLARRALAQAAERARV
ncbi:MAG: FAD binding domain-containing protein [Ktedonobacterales bacterium]